MSHFVYTSTYIPLAMAFAGAHNADASQGTFNDMRQSQYNCIFLAPALAVANVYVWSPS